jgi:hypothetical protein
LPLRVTDANSNRNGDGDSDRNGDSKSNTKPAAAPNSCSAPGCERDT